MKDKSKVLKTYGYMFDKLQFICLIGGGRVAPKLACTPSIRQVYQFLHTHYFKQKRQLIIAD